MNQTNPTASRPEQSAAPAAALVPPVDVFEDDAGITLYADLPGVPRERLAIDVEGETLTIAGEVALEVPEGMEATHAEVDVPRYRRVFTLSKDLDPGKITAEYRNGVLQLRIPKVEQVRPRRVEVRVV